MGLEYFFNQMKKEGCYKLDVTVYVEHNPKTTKSVYNFNAVFIFGVIRENRFMSDSYL